MKLCTTCGNEIEDHLRKCPYCEQTQTGPPPEPIRQPSIRTINLKERLPTVAGAILQLKRELKEARAERRKLVRLIHGYGSTGVGGEIRVAVRKHLQAMLADRKVLSVVAGEDYSTHTNAGADLLSRHHTLRSTLRTDSANPGITFVEL